MKTRNFICCLMVALASFAPNQNTFAQEREEEVSETGNIIKKKVNDGIYKSNISNRLPLEHHHIEERDVMWEKRLWREIDVKELRNHHFAYEKRHFVTILLEAAAKGDITAYSAMNDEFTEELTKGQMDECLYKEDTAYVYNLETGMMDPVVVRNEFNPSDVKRYRIKEVMYFDSRLGRMNTRILGIAPIINKYDDNGNFIASMPLCWFYYDELRPVLAKEPMFSAVSDTKGMSWDDVFESRYFASYITKESNTRDLRLQDIYSGIDVLRESEKIKEGIFNYEQDLFQEH